MMNSEDKILKLIEFADESEVEEAVKYLQKIRSLKIDALKKESWNLKDNLNNLEEKAKSAAFSNYPAFIKTAESSRKVLKGWTEATKNVEGLIDNLQLPKKCDEFVQKTLAIQQNSRLNSLTLKNHVELLEILELPQLMELSIREEKYEDALELASYVQKMGNNFENAPIVNEIVKKIDSSWQVMLSQLLHEMKCDLTLPKCLKVVGFIRRMQAFSTLELKLKFLQTRDSWLKETVSAIPKSEPHHHLTKTIEVTRVSLFNIVTQYKALFEEDFGREADFKVNLLFNSWIYEKIDDFIRFLDNDLAQHNYNLMDTSSILGQCMYFGVSFSRIGIDFRAQLGPIFLKSILKQLNLNVMKATKQFELDMEHFTLINRDVMSRLRNKTETQDSKLSRAIEVLLDFEPLAIYYNALMNVFNELRICSPAGIAHSFTVMVESSLEVAAKAIKNFYRNEQAAFGAKEKENFHKMCKCFSQDLLPNVQQCIHDIFPSKAKHMQRVETLTTLRTEKILKTLSFAL